ncbi:hypothetical protein [Hymenobacter arcticus]
MDNCLSAFVEHLVTLDKHVAPKGTSISSEGLFGALVKNELRARVAAESIDQAADLVNSYYQAVELCRSHQLPAAETQLLHCDERLRSLPAEASAFVLLSRAGAWSNYYYKVQRGEQAIEVLREGFRISADLERRGYAVFLYWRIGQLFNVTTVLYKQQALERAHHLLRNSLVFTYSGRATDLLIDDWPGPAVGEVRVLQESCLDQLFGQLARQNTLLMAHEQYGNAYYYQFFFKQLLHEMEAETYNRVVLYNWMHAKASYQEEGLRAFLDNTLDFLTDPAITRDYDIYKVNLLAQVSWSIRQQRPHDAQLTAQVKQFSDANYSDWLGNRIRLTP